MRARAKLDPSKPVPRIAIMREGLPHSGIARLDRTRHGQLSLAVARLDLDLDGLGVDLHELRDHLRDLLAHLLQPAAVEAGAIVREHEVQAALRDLARWLT